jgi:hypothetical protein
MALLSCLLLLASPYPLWVAWTNNRSTTLRPTLAWAFLAWAVWLATALLACFEASVSLVSLGRFFALTLTGCAGVAVFGARRPGVAAWNFVVVGLLVVMLLPLAEQLLIGDFTPSWLQAGFLGVTLAVGAGNYVPTRFGPAAVLLGLGCAVEMFWLLHPSGLASLPSPGWLAVGLVPLLALTSNRRRPSAEEDRLWLQLRDRFGLLWAERTREQLNYAAAHAGWPVVLRWRGFVWKGEPTAVVRAEVLAALRAACKRFLTDPEKSGFG